MTRSDGHRASRRDGVSVPKLILALVIEFGVFPWETFKGNAAVRRKLILSVAVFAIAVTIPALASGNPFAGLVAAAVLGAMLLFLIAAHRRIERDRRAERARRLAQRRRLTEPE